MPKAILQVSPEWFTGMLKSAKEGGTRRYDVIKNALPEDARVVKVWTDENSPFRVINVLLESASFPKVSQAKGVPYLEPPHIEVYYDEDSSLLDKAPA